MEHKQETLKNCPVCGSKKLKKHLETQDYFLTQEHFSLYSCVKCKFVFTNPRPQEQELGHYYKSEDYISHSNAKKGLFAWIYQTVRNYTLHKKYQWVVEKKQGDKILDIGCATGQLLSEFKDRGWSCTGVEPDPDARAFAEKEYQLKVVAQEEMNSLADASFDVISMWHVLEHVADLDQRMNDLKRLIKANGFLFIALPNINSWDANHYKEYWAGLDVPRHLYHFGKENVTFLFKEYGFELVEIKPLKFDAYYVSLLSEKYKNNFFYFVSAFFKGFYSNLKAKKNTPNHSSLLYILKPLVV